MALPHHPRALRGTAALLTTPWRGHRGDRALDSALRRAGRFDREICMGVPDEEARKSILTVLTSRLRLAGDFDMDELARRTPA